MKGKRNKSIVFTGFMGVGKTTVAKLVAEKLGRKFIDIDLEIESQFDMLASDIFRMYGEDFFREAEKKMIQKSLTDRPQVLSLGGGAFLSEETRSFCMANCFVIFLDISWTAWQERLPLLMTNRPVLENKSIDDIKALFEFRKTTYASYHEHILTDDKSPTEIAEIIVRLLK